MEKGQTEIIASVVLFLLATASITGLIDYHQLNKTTNQPNSLNLEIFPPENVSAEPGPTLGQITIAWNEVAGAEYYNVRWRAENSVGTFHHVPLTIMTDSFNFEEKKYYYQVQACNQFDECSEYSEWTSAYPQIAVKINSILTAETNELILALAEVELTDWPEINWSITGNSSCNASILNKEELKMTCSSKGNVNISVTIKTQENNIATDSKTIEILESEISGVPETPEGIAVRPGNNSGEIETEWSKVDGADYYEVKWTVPNSIYGNIIQVDKQLNSIVYKTTFPPDQSLEYHGHEIRACNTQGCSDYTIQFLALPKLRVEIQSPSIIEENNPKQINAELTFFNESTFDSYEWHLINNTANCFLDDYFIKQPEIQCSSIGFVTLKVIAYGNNFDYALDEKTISVNTSPVSIPPVPNNVKAEKGTAPGKIKVSWNASPAAEYYEIKYRAQGFVSDKRFESNLSSFEFKTDVPPNEIQPIHYISVRACNNFGCSNFSSEKQALPKMNIIILSPKTAEKNQTFNLEALTEYSFGEINYSWETSSQQTQCTIQNPNSKTTTITCYPEGFTEINLKANNNEYLFFDSAEDNKLIEINELVFDLQPPQNIKAVPGDNSNEIKLTWTPSNGAEKYAIEWHSEHLNPNWLQPYRGTIETSLEEYVFVWNKPEEETGKFYFKIFAVNGNNTSDYSEKVWSYLK